MELFNGEDLSGWICKPDGWHAAEGCIVWAPKSGYIWTERRFGDFLFTCQFKIDPGVNSGIFIRTADPDDPVQTGIEMQILDTYGQPVDKHSCGAVYDCLAPSESAEKPAGEWNDVRIECRDNLIRIDLNGTRIIDMDLNEWTEPNRNPDGTENKFDTPLKEFAREGHIGFQDHGGAVWYRNIEVEQLG